MPSTIATRPERRVRRRRVHDDERGAGLVEYALLVALIAVVCIGAVTFLGTSNSSKIDRAGTAINGDGPAVADCYNTLGGMHHDVYEDGSESAPLPGPCP